MRSPPQTFKFSLGEGKVIGGWEVALSSMRPGELATITVSPQYAYGEKGIPPMIPQSLGPEDLLEGLQKLN